MKVRTKITTTLITPMGKEIIETSTLHEESYGDNPKLFPDNVIASTREAADDHITTVNSGLNKVVSE